MALGRILEGFIVILVGVNLVGPVSDSVYGSYRILNGTDDVASPNVTGAPLTLIQLTTLFFVLGIMTAGVQIAVGGLADIGLV